MDTDRSRRPRNPCLSCITQAKYVVVVDIGSRKRFSRSRAKILGRDRNNRESSPSLGRGMRVNGTRGPWKNFARV